MDEQDIAPEAPTPDDERLLRFIFDTEREYYEETAPVWGVPVTFRVLTTFQAQEADYVAASIGAENARDLERSVQALARAIVRIDQRDFAALPLEERLAELQAWPFVLVQACAAASLRATQSYVQAVNDPERLKNSSGVAA